MPHRVEARPPSGCYRHRGVPRRAGDAAPRRALALLVRRRQRRIELKRAPDGHFHWPGRSTAWRWTSWSTPAPPARRCRARWREKAGWRSRARCARPPPAAWSRAAGARRPRAARRVARRALARGRAAAARGAAARHGRDLEDATVQHDGVLTLEADAMKNPRLAWWRAAGAGLALPARKRNPPPPARRKPRRRRRSRCRPRRRKRRTAACCGASARTAARTTSSARSTSASSNGRFPAPSCAPRWPTRRRSPSSSTRWTRGAVQPAQRAGAGSAQLPLRWTSN